MKNILSRIIACKYTDSTAEFARKIGLHPQTVNNYLTEKRKFSLEFFIAVCRNCNVSADWLLGFSDSRTGTCAPAPDPAVAKKLAEAEAEIARLNGVIDGMKMSFEALRR